jgi:hypothetical protein
LDDFKGDDELEFANSVQTENILAMSARTYDNTYSSKLDSSMHLNTSLATYSHDDFEEEPEELNTLKTGRRESMTVRMVKRKDPRKEETKNTSCTDKSCCVI